MRFCRQLPWLRVAWCDNLASSRRMASDGVSQAAQDAMRERAKHIRRQELLRRYCRRLIIPGFTCYGLYLLRPTEGHFLRYLAERRHYDAAFHQLFPPIADTARPPATNSEGRVNKLDDTPMTATRTGDDTWLRHRLHVRKGGEDEQRVARLRRLFAHGIDTPIEDNSTGEGGANRAARDAAARTGGRAAPPVYVISEQLQQMLAESKRYHVPRPDAHIARAPTVEIDFHDCIFYATAALTFHRADGRPVMRLHFVGACETLWRQTSQHLLDADS